ncbi:hypothetical protein VTH82DRAFT_8110 [Thermothelomyces myriococcoides]
MEEERTITLDLGSSPDPLIDPVLSPPMMPPSAIKKKTQAAERLVTAFAPPSPRKQTFELDVGDERTPQRLLVTVEAESGGPRSTTRRLFQSPTPKQRRLTPRRDPKSMVTTTTVPLRGLSDDEGVTPRRRGRPRKSGTPMTARRKRPGTPANVRKSTGHVPVSPEKAVATSDAKIETTPRASTERATKRKATSPAKEDDGVPGSQPRKRGRPRKQTSTADDIAPLGRDIPRRSGDDGDALTAPAPSQPTSNVQQNNDNDYDDIWLANLSDQPASLPPARQQERAWDRVSEVPVDNHPAESELQRPRREPEPEQEQRPQYQYDWPDVGGGADSYSEAESLASDQDGFENTMMAEEFTMISIGSLPSMQQNSSIMAPANEELGEATSLIINGALESLRQSRNRATEEQQPYAEPTGPDLASAPAPALIQERPSGSTRTAESPVPQDEPRREAQQQPSSPQPLRRSPRRTTTRSPARQLTRKSPNRTARQSPTTAPTPAPAPASVPDRLPTTTATASRSPAPRRSPVDDEPQDPRPLGSHTASRNSRRRRRQLMSKPKTSSRPLNGHQK